MKRGKHLVFDKTNPGPAAFNHFCAGSDQQAFDVVPGNRAGDRRAKDRLERSFVLAVHASMIENGGRLCNQLMPAPISG